MSQTQGTAQGVNEALRRLGEALLQLQREKGWAVPAAQEALMKGVFWCLVCRSYPLGCLHDSLTGSARLPVPVSVLAGLGKSFEWSKGRHDCPLPSPAYRFASWVRALCTVSITASPH